MRYWLAILIGSASWASDLPAQSSLADTLSQEICACITERAYDRPANVAPQCLYNVGLAYEERTQAVYGMSARQYDQRQALLDTIASTLAMNCPGLRDFPSPVFRERNWSDIPARPSYKYVAPRLGDDPVSIPPPEETASIFGEATQYATFELTLIELRPDGTMRGKDDTGESVLWLPPHLQFGRTWVAGTTHTFKCERRLVAGIGLRWEVTSVD
ncbi:hypothetical protein [Lewinella sp. 4G2]|uniref:hypothetical protein n=1 Tax=Lewinella sp. 4G2 TaxID=1803372 RepID=UPI0007B494AA|nr:hypothetical protein [Lewinella sp. 4G2]OAV44628.1 hypothetical protein A3850_009045 [Lewinella sp. 4G2]